MKFAHARACEHACAHVPHRAPRHIIKVTSTALASCEHRVQASEVVDNGKDCWPLWGQIYTQKIYTVSVSWASV